MGNVVLNGNQQKNIRTGRDDTDDVPWLCANCLQENAGSYKRCERCQVLRPDERTMRQEMRRKDGDIGKGGGFFQRSSAEDREQWDSDNEEYDEFGRKKRKVDSSATKKSQTSSAKDKAAAASEKQKAALERL